jgi:class 3 adenylate cyclase/predicted ATPase
VAKPVAPAQERIPRDYTPKHLADKILQSKSALEGERKQVTVLFADVKGSMELAEQVDPEEWHRILDRFFQILADGVHRFEGTVNQYTGDGIMALFGAPIAHEDHAQRACYAALHLRDALRSYSEELKRARGVNFSVRIGLNSGEVVVGKIGDDLRMDYTAQGHTVGLAQRMEQLASSESAYVTAQTARLVEGFFQLRDLGGFELKGAAEPLRVFELQGVGPLRTRLEVAASRGLVRFVGRRGELEQLRRAWDSARAGHGQIVAVVGEAGVGKSRLVYEFKAPLERGCRVLEAFSVSHGKAYAYLPLIDLLKGYFGIALEDDERQRREKITGKVLTLDRTLEDALPYLFTLLGIAEETTSLAQMDPQIRRQRTLEAVKRVLVRETLDQPCVVIFEDLHWIDSETQAFLELMAESVATAKLLLLVDYRPEYRHGWGSKTYYTQLRLDPLGEEEARELLAALLGEGMGAEREALERLVLEKTEGNPFFMEEVVKTLAEEGVLVGERGRYRLEKPPGELHIPATVQGVLVARIDRLPAEEKDLLQTLSVIGVEFPFGLLKLVAEGGEEELRGRLSHLQAGEFVYEQPAFPEPEYTFKHALTQEVAYGSLLAERRGAVHERTARAIEELYGDALDEHYGELAHHYSRTDNAAKAIEYLHLAGRQARERSAYGEAIRQVTKGLEMLETLPETPECNQQELLLQITLGQALMPTKGWTAPEVERTYSRVRELCRQADDTPELFPALVGLWIVYYAQAELHECYELGQRLLSLAQRQQEPALLSAAHSTLGYTTNWRGELIQSREHLERSVALYDPQQHQVHVSLLGYDVGAVAGSAASLPLWCLGYPDQALERSRQAMTLARDLSHPVSLAAALSWAAGFRANRGDDQASQELADTLIELSSECGFPDWLGWGVFLRGRALVEQGDREAGIAQMQQVADAFRTTGYQIAFPNCLGTLAEARGKVGEPQEGLALVAEAMDAMNRTGQGVAESYLCRLKGELLLGVSKDSEAEAETCLQRAIGVARRQSAKSYELRAAMSLSRLWQKRGKKKEARELLADIYGWFTEGFDTADLKEAKALLTELGP